MWWRGGEETARWLSPCLSLRRLHLSSQLQQGAWGGATTEQRAAVAAVRPPCRTLPPLFLLDDGHHGDAGGLCVRYTIQGDTV